MPSLQFDFVVFLGDPDEGAEAVASREALERVAEIKESLQWPDVYGCVRIRSDGEELLNHRPDPIVPLVTGLVRCVPFLLEGEPETALLSESEHGFAFEPSDRDVTVSFFAGDAYEPDEFLVEPTLVPLTQFGREILDLGTRLRDLMKSCDPDVFEGDDYSKGLLEFLEEGETKYKTYQLQIERGLRA